jgi:hypothetical protein
LDNIREPHPIELIVYDLPIPLGETVVLESEVPLGGTAEPKTAVLEMEVPPQEVEKPKVETLFQRLQCQKKYLVCMRISYDTICFI